MELIGRGKVRDLYRVAPSRLLLVASDRISTYDVVHPTLIPDKGKILTAMSAFWFQYFTDVVDSHMISVGVADFGEASQAHGHWLAGRTMLVHEVEIIPFECVVRGYLVGSGWTEYQRDGSVCGIALPDGLVEAARLPEPIFTPATKAEQGEHDENISFELMASRVGQELATRTRDLSLELYRRAAALAAVRGIILADTKFEFGLLDGKIVLADEVLTPDSSRYWPADQWRPGAVPPSLDKQYVRDFVRGLGWDKEPPAPELSAEVVAATRQRYIEIYQRITERLFVP